ncbi:LOW QUALITY PROTEIN: hypothetical protein Cgig2_027726 [Carnegiea gigantea]|uniref:Uncharacterized protein n=1 Tax=Carnegiea gigantea TaxID=171969 RepID=A0A9Q1JWF2_9CARY|nr:LOW QUALITY PROTEIN: hypothetical protein Cgig2_027726 [Carnegiea gigantea]
MVPLSKPSNGSIIVASLNYGGDALQPSSTHLSVVGVGPNPTQASALSHDSGRLNVKRTRKGAPSLRGTSIQGHTPSTHSQVDILVNTMVKNHHKEVHQYRSLEKRELIVYCLARVAMGICKDEPNMLDSTLHEKLDKHALCDHAKVSTTKGLHWIKAATKGNMQQEGIGNGGF